MAAGLKAGEVGHDDSEPMRASSRPASTANGVRTRHLGVAAEQLGLADAAQLEQDRVEARRAPQALEEVLVQLRQVGTQVEQRLQRRRGGVVVPEPAHEVNVAVHVPGTQEPAGGRQVGACGLDLPDAVR